MSGNVYAGTGIFATLGLDLQESEEGLVKAGLEIGPEHLNRMGYVHGGVICTMIDFAACAAGLHAPEGGPSRYAVTVSLATQFTRPVKSGWLAATGRMISATKSSYTAEAHVFDSDGALVAHGIGTFRWRPGSQPGAA